MRMTRVLGLKKTMALLKQESLETNKRVRRGMIKGGLFLQRKSQQVAPVDTGNMKNSAFTRGKGQGRKFEVTVGYTASYALFVHENLNMRHKPGKEAKFLEGPLRKHRREIDQIIVQESTKK